MRSSKDRKRRNYAVLSKVAYESNDKHNVEKAMSSYGLGRIIKYLPKLSTSSYKTFYNNRTNKAVIAFRGTQPTNLSDLAADTAIFFGVERLFPRFNEALAHAKLVEKTVGKGNVELTGHSLGGSEALYVTEKTGMPSTVFNPGKTFEQFDLLEKYDKVRNAVFSDPNKQNNKNTQIYNTRFDPISFNATRTKGDVDYVKACGYNVHAIDNFIDS